MACVGKTRTLRNGVHAEWHNCPNKYKIFVKTNFKLKDQNKPQITYTEFREFIDELKSKGLVMELAIHQRDIKIVTTEKGDRACETTDEAFYRMIGHEKK